MREKKFTRIAAFLLCLCTLLGNVFVVASATEPSDTSSSIDTSYDELRELLNAITYQEYLEKYTAKRAETSIDVPIADFVIDSQTQLPEDATQEEKDKMTFYMKEIDGVAGLYTPQTGAVSWTIDLPEKGKYAICIEYYPDQNRATSIERILKINDKVPFSEARFLTLPKRWVNDYAVAYVTPNKGTSADALAEKAREAGFIDVSVEDGKVKFETFPEYYTAAMTEFAEEYDVRFFQRDTTNNEIRPTAVDQPQWMTYYLKDSTGYTTENFEFVFDKGENKITLESQNEPMTIKAIKLYPLEDVPAFEDYKADLEKAGLWSAGQDVIKLEAELAHVMSNKTIYPVEDCSCAINSPTDVTCSVLNTIGGEKWATAGQWVEYKFKVETSGTYDIVSRFRQNILDGMYTCRSMFLYSEGVEEGKAGYYNGAPFAEALKLTYDYSDEWQVTQLANSEVRDTNGNGTIDEDDEKVVDTYSVYLAAGTVYTVRFEVTLGKMGEIVRDVEDILNSVNNDYLEIIKLTGITPDQYRDYGFTQVMPQVMTDMVIRAGELEALAQQLRAIAGESSSNVATLEKVARLLKEMGRDDDEVAKNLANLKSYIGTLGTFLSDVRTQPLQLDYIMVQPAGAEEPKATPGFFQSFLHEMKGFFQSFVRDYNSMGALEQDDADNAEPVEVWLASARDQSQVIRNLINNDFTAKNGITVDLKLVAGGTLLPSILAGSGPDVYLGLLQGDVINYAIRSALVNIETMGSNTESTDDDFATYVEENFNEAAMIVLGIEDADEQMHYYGLPETQSFPMMFVRIDIMADLGLNVPKTWDDIMSCIPTLQANNMQIGLTTDYKIFLYQQGGDLFADDGMRINLDSQLGLASFEKMCNLFTMYSFPYQYDAANRFRTGEMPILLGDYCGTYNQLKVFATEIEGKWEFMPLPCEIQADGSVNNVSISGVSATVMIKGCEGEAAERAWQYMMWYTGAEFQENFSNEMVAILGPSAKQAVSNKNALRNLPWTTSEYEKVQAQFSNLGSVPNYPGAYIIDRYTNFAFLSAFNDNANPSDALMAYIATINKEIERKRNEFNLEVLGDYKDLLTKRLTQINDLIGFMREKNGDKAAQYADLLDRVAAASRSDDNAELKAMADEVMALYESLDPDGTIFTEDRTAVMGYDMTDASLTKAQRKKLRKCFSYEVYENTEIFETQLKCMVDFLEDAARLTPDN